QQGGNRDQHRRPHGEDGMLGAGDEVAPAAPDAEQRHDYRVGGQYEDEVDGERSEPDHRRAEDIQLRMDDESKSIIKRAFNPCSGAVISGSHSTAARPAEVPRPVSVRTSTGSWS